MPMKGTLAIQGPAFSDYKTAANQMNELSSILEKVDLSGIPLIIIVDDSEFVAAELNNYLWVTYTRANPSHDIYGINSFVEHKHWGCNGPLVIDARIKPHHAPPLVRDPNVVAKVDRMFEEIEVLKKLM